MTARGRCTYCGAALRAPLGDGAPDPGAATVAAALAGRSRATVPDVLAALDAQATRRSQGAARRAVAILRALGWHPTTRRARGRLVWVPRATETAERFIPHDGDI
jgi:hypothetical protein